MKKKEKLNKLTSAPAHTAKSDIQRLKEVLHRLLDRLERALMAPPKGVEKHQQHEWIFGQKTSLAETLLMLAELILKLEDTAHKEEIVDPAFPRAVSVADAALVEAFLARVRQSVPADNANPICPTGSTPS